MSAFGTRPASCAGSVKAPFGLIGSDCTRSWSTVIGLPAGNVWVATTTGKLASVAGVTATGAGRRDSVHANRPSSNATAISTPARILVRFGMTTHCFG